MEPNSSLRQLPLTHNAKQAQYMEIQQDVMFLVSLSPYLSTLDIQMFGHIVLNKIVPKYSKFFLKYPVYLKKSQLKTPWVCM